MIEAARIGPLRALPQSILSPLGRINVICGQNNSGKSTILEALSEAGTRDDGAVLTEERVLELATATATTPQQSTEPYQNAIRAIVEAAARAQKDRIWFRSQTQEFVAACQNAGRENRYVAAFGWSPAELARKYNTLFGPVPLARLLPSKRRLEESVAFNAGQTLMQDGAGLLNYLFYGLSRIYDNDNLLVAEILEAFKSITGGVQARPEVDRGGTLRLMFRAPGQSWVPATFAGVGFQGLIQLLYVAIEPEASLALVEEPENHLHPDMQRKLMSFLREHTTKQFFLSTHSNVFLSDDVAEQVFVTVVTPTIRVTNESSRAQALRELGYSVSDNLRADVVIFVEGKHDMPILQHFLDEMGLTDGYSIRLWLLNGDNMRHVDLGLFHEQSNIIALIDRDPKSERARILFQERCQKLGIRCHRLARYALENYFTLDALREIFPSEIPPALTAINPDISLRDQVGFDVKRRNHALARHTSLKGIEGTDLMDFLNDVRQLAEKT